MFKRFFRNRSSEREGLVRSTGDMVRDRRNIGLWNDPVPDYSRTAPNPTIRNRARYLVANSAVAARAVQAFVDNVVGSGITLLPKIANVTLKSELLDAWNALDRCRRTSMDCSTSMGSRRSPPGWLL